MKFPIILAHTALLIKAEMGQAPKGIWEILVRPQHAVEDLDEELFIWGRFCGGGMKELNCGNVKEREMKI